ncbi:MAG TPA: hypothetical protein VHS56_04085 [Candidatus Cybelea sp.]|nr:hypothetical protein [Candidatus Cybelea sp.]
MLSKSLIALTASAILGSTALGLARPVAPARVFGPAQTFVQPDHKKKTPIKAGIVNSSGSIVSGTGYSVSHDGTGEYTLDVPAGYFSTCPAIVASPAGLNGHLAIPDVYDYVTCGNNGEVKVQIREYEYNTGALQDNAFHFVMIGT